MKYSELKNKLFKELIKELNIRELVREEVKYAVSLILEMQETKRPAQTTLRPSGKLSEKLKTSTSTFLSEMVGNRQIQDDEVESVDDDVTLYGHAHVAATPEAQRIAHEIQTRDYRDIMKRTAKK